MRLKLNHENRFLNSFKISPKMVYTALLLFLLAFVIVILPSSFASLQPVKSVEIFSEKLNYQNNEPGAWKVTQSAKWTKKGEAEVTIDIDSIGKINNTPKDILLVVDISGGVESRIELIVNELGSFIQKFLINKNNNVGLITYNTTSEVVLDFTNNEENILNKLSELKVGGARSYYQALIGINNVIEKYKYENNKDCEVIFLTTGEPNVDSPSEIGEYINLKTKYPFLKMNIVRYNKGSLNDNYLYKISDSKL